MHKKIKINSKISIGEDCPCFVIAEAGVNHNGKLDLALQQIFFRLHPFVQSSKK